MTTDLSDDELARKLRASAEHQYSLGCADCFRTLRTAASRIEQLGSERADAMTRLRQLSDDLEREENRASAAESRVTEALQSFRDFVSDNGGVRNFTTSRGDPTNHHNPIWAEIADLLAALSTPATPPSRAGEEK